MMSRPAAVGAVRMAVKEATNRVRMSGSVSASRGSRTVAAAASACASAPSPTPQQRRFSAAHRRVTPRQTHVHVGEVEVKEGSISFSLGDGKAREVSQLWLRDHCTCSACCHPETKQRLSNTAAFIHDTTGMCDIKSARIDDQGHELVVEWKDGHVSKFSSGWLSELGQSPRDNPRVLRGERERRVIWDLATLQERGMPDLSASEFLAGPEGIAKAMELVNRYGFAFVHGIEPTEEATEAMLKRIGPIRETLYGGFWSFTADMKKTDTAYTNIPLGSHTDGTYFNEVPGLQCFHLIYHDGEGGATTLVDSFRAVRDLAQWHPESVEYLVKKKVSWHHFIDGNYLFQKRPILTLAGDIHRSTPVVADTIAFNLEMLSMNNDDRAPMTFDTPADADEFYLHYGRLLDMISRPDGRLQMRLPAGTVCILNNWRVMHGRTGFTGKRQMCGAYFNTEDYQMHLNRRLIEEQNHLWEQN